MPQTTNSAAFVTSAGEQTVSHEQILRAMAEFDRKGLRDKPTIGDNKRGWSIEENGKRYNPKWILKLATGTGLGKFANKQARETLGALGFKLHHDPDCDEKVDNQTPLNSDGEDEGAKEADELTFDLERNLQSVLRAHIEQLEAGLKITDGGKEQKVDFGGGKWGLIDITAQDRNGATVVIELKAGEAGRRAIGQILGYMGVLIHGEKTIRGILVAEDFSPQGIAAAHVVPDLQLTKYNFKFSFETVSVG